MRQVNLSSITKCASILSVLIFGATLSFAQTAPKRTISASYVQVKGANNKFYSEVVGAGRAAEGLRTDWMRGLATVHRECGFKYVRFHGLLQDEMGVYREDKRGNAVYNFQYIDALYDSILNIGMKPFVELGFMPEKLASGNKTVFWWKGNISPPKDFDKWQKLIRELVRHWTERYGEEEVKQWYFEVWNEPNLDFFWSGTQAEYFKLYDVTAKAVKSVSPKYRVGGPATAGRSWITETIDFASKNKVPLDFITTHDYGVSGVGFDEDGNQKLFLVTDQNAITGGVREVNKQIRSSAMPDLPLHYTEWSSSYSPRDPVHDSYLSAPYILSKLKGAAGFADSMSYWTFTDIFEENGPVPSAFHGGFGMINFQGLRKPSFYAYQFLNRLGNEELTSNDADSWTTRSKNGVQILFWNFTPPITKESDQIFYKKDLPAKDFGKVQVKIADIPAGNYQMNIYQIGYQVNDVYTSYLKMGSPRDLNREQVKELNDKNNGQTIETLQIRIDKKLFFTKELNVRENDVFMIILEKR
ncbi:MAG: glycoside hydrolase [Actinomycetota bacterium]